jgi:hypothetical protein
MEGSGSRKGQGQYNLGCCLAEQAILYACPPVFLESLDALKLTVDASPVLGARFTRICAWKSNHCCAWKSEGSGKKGLTTVVGGVGVAEGLRATVEVAADRNGCNGDGEYGKKTKQVVPGREEAGRGLAGDRPPSSPWTRRRRHGVGMMLRAPPHLRRMCCGPDCCYLMCGFDCMARPMILR